MRSSAAGLGAVILAAAAALFLLPLIGITGQGDSGPGAGARPDGVRLGTLEVFGDLERPAVAFPHDLHTEALEGEEAACVTCHPMEKNRLVYSSFRLPEAGDRQAVTRAYHDACIGCHEKKTDAGLKSGPETCGECHSRKPRFLSSWRPLLFDQTLHHEHTEVLEGGCGTCHHLYDEEEEALTYAKGEESACRECHASKGREDRGSVRSVSHQTCIGCHQDYGVSPTDCTGCHGAGEQGPASRPGGMPRLERGQPDSVLLSASLKDPAAGEMNAVLFDHKAHEQATATCSDCHHETLKGCRACHEIRGSEQAGRAPALERAMHDATSRHSCVGCHEERKSHQGCAGCHAFMQKGVLPETACDGCHNGPPPGLEPETAASAPAARRDRERQAFSPEDVPEEVLISGLSSRYEPALFPHREVIAALEDSVKDSRLASRFHATTESICQGCHHRGPAGGGIPRCASCHGKTPNGRLDPSVPGLLGAYHRQCIGCHEQMQQENASDCTSCHELKRE
ncbi:MAG: sulfate respiration complex hexadecaheme cytochrome HmcA [bacterium]